MAQAMTDQTRPTTQARNRYKYGTYETGMPPDRIYKFWGPIPSKATRLIKFDTQGNRLACITTDEARRLRADLAACLTELGEPIE